MDQESNQMEQHPVQCRNGCGFYSNAGTEGLCSVCYKDMIKKRQQPPTNMPASLTPAPGAMASLSIDESAAAAAAAASGTTTSPSSSSPIKPSTSLETASPTVVLPSQTDKRAESEGAEGTGSGTPGASAIATVAANLDTSSSDVPPSPASPGTEAGGQKESKKKKNRCLACKKKVGLTGFECRCGGLFCSIHRYSDKHECNFDYKELGAEEIRKSNPVVVAKKVQKI